MPNLIMRHYVLQGGNCEPCAKTAETLRKLGSQMAPRLAPLGLELSLQEAEMHEATEENLAKANLITFSCPEANMDEIALEEILGLGVTHEPCENCEHGTCRSIQYQGTGYQEIPPGLISDGLVRAAFSIMEGGDGSSCGGCGG